MKNVKFLLSAALVFVVGVASAQDFSAPEYAKYGATPEEREQNILSINFLKESYDNRDYNAASGYVAELIKNCPTCSQSIYQRGATIYKYKIQRAKSITEKNALVDSLMLMYDMRNEYFGDNGGSASAKIIDIKAREILFYKPADRPAIRKAFRDAIAMGGNDTDPETVVAYFSNLCDDYKNTDQVMPEEVINEYDRLISFFDHNPDASDFKLQFDASFGASGAASCENLEKLFKGRMAANPTDETMLYQAVSLMSRANCSSPFYFEISEKYYEVKPSSETALFLAQAFQNKGDYPKAMKYINESLISEENPVERQKLYIRLGLINLVSNNVSAAAAAARQARDLIPEDGVAYFLLAQCYADSASACGGFVGQTTFWAAYDTMAKAIDLLSNNVEYLTTAKTLLAAYRSRFPSAEECFFSELKEGARYTVNCGTASGIVTTVRSR